VSAAVQAIRRINPALPIVVGLLVALVAIGAAFSDRFGTLRNFTNVFEQAAGLGFVSLGQTLVILTGGIDLSIDGIVTVAAMLTSGLIDGDPTRVVPVVAAVLLIGTLIGALNGALTVLLRVHPLIVTIGMASVLQGAGLLYSLNPPGSVPPEFEGFAYGRVVGVPIAGAIMLGLFLLVGTFLRSTRLGRQIYAVGGDPFAARLIGIPHDKVIIVAYALSGLFAALTAVYLVSRLGIGDPWAGQGWALRSITPVVVGGTLLAGGRGGVTGTLLGVFLISLLNNLLNYLDVSTYYQWIIQGLIIIVAVSVYVERRRRA
jgi:ribose/xylose/arabinose/galactoside ABC-type transport system permease subunit